MTGCGEPKNYEDFAKCLTSKNLTMFGAEWCPHCQNVKKEFGNAFRFIEYVECDANTPGADPQRCSDSKIDYLPTFKFQDGTRLFGEVSFDILAMKTGCRLP
jgi:hypothetical protein